VGALLCLCLRSLRLIIVETIENYNGQAIDMFVFVNLTTLWLDENTLWILRKILRSVVGNEINGTGIITTILILLSCINKKKIFVGEKMQFLSATNAHIYVSLCFRSIPSRVRLWRIITRKTTQRKCIQDFANYEIMTIQSQEKWCTMQITKSD
jgi:hypothetical protein